MSGRLVAINAPFGDVVVEAEAAASFGVTVESVRGGSDDAIVAAAGTADGVLVQYVQLDSSVIERCPTWRVIGRYGVGVDNVDVEAATRQGIAVINVPDYCIEEVATHAAALALAGWRKVAQSSTSVALGRWTDWQGLRPIRPLSASTLGLVGLGRIGTEVARMLRPFFARTVAYDPVQPMPGDVETLGVEEVFAQADVLSLHCPLTPYTANLVNAARLATMKPGALLVNVSRGGLVDTAALAAGLREGRPAAAALDVLPQEPPARDDPLLSAPNLLLTNHVAWYSEEALIRLRRLIGQRCAAYLVGQPVSSVANAHGLSEKEVKR